MSCEHAASTISALTTLARVSFYRARATLPEPGAFGEGREGGGVEGGRVKRLGVAPVLGAVPVGGATQHVYTVVPAAQPQTVHWVAHATTCSQPLAHDHWTERVATTWRRRRRRRPQPRLLGKADPLRNARARQRSGVGRRLPGTGTHAASSSLVLTRSVVVLRVLGPLGCTTHGNERLRGSNDLWGVRSGGAGEH